MPALPTAAPVALALLLAGLVGPPGGALRAAPPLVDVPALAGQPPAAIAAAVGAPSHPLDATGGGDEGDGPPPLFDLTYAPPGVGPLAGARLTVTYCEGRAVSFHLALAEPAPSPGGLLAAAGLPPGALALEEDGAGHKAWGPAERGGAGRLAGVEGLQLERALATYSAPLEGGPVLRGAREEDRAGRPEGRRPRAGWTALVVDYSAPC